jgi:hypothetical protein
LKTGLSTDTSSPPEVDGLGPDDDEKEEIFLDEYNGTSFGLVTQR